MQWDSVRRSLFRNFFLSVNASPTFLFYSRLSKLSCFFCTFYNEREEFQYIYVKSEKNFKNFKNLPTIFVKPFSNLSRDPVPFNLLCTYSEHHREKKSLLITKLFRPEEKRKQRRSWVYFYTSRKAFKCCKCPPLPPSGLKALQNFRSLHAEIFYPIKGLPFQTKMLHYFTFLVNTSRRGEIYNRICSVPGR